MRRPVVRSCCRAATALRSSRARRAAEQIRNRIKTVLKMAVVLTYGAAMPIVKTGRISAS